MLHDAQVFSGFSVDDLSVAKQFYGETLGVEVAELPMGILGLFGGKTIIYPKPDHVPATFTVLNFRVPDLAAVVDGLSAKGVKFEHYDSEWIKTDARGIADQGGRHMAWFTDPAGNILGLIQDDENTA